MTNQRAAARAMGSLAGTTFALLAIVGWRRWLPGWLLAMVAVVFVVALVSLAVGALRARQQGSDEVGGSG
ncbi:MAG: hypothetical protein HY241_09995 [Actinobacteria bacterium]|nr:hypothetical protein [Actinomycetota bacterium]